MPVASKTAHSADGGPCMNTENKLQMPNPWSTCTMQRATRYITPCARWALWRIAPAGTPLRWRNTARATYSG
eukprot:453879-Lingulodinium_polyedra.AAC.1